MILVEEGVGVGILLVGEVEEVVVAVTPLAVDASLHDQTVAVAVEPSYHEEGEEGEIL